MIYEFQSADGDVIERQYPVDKRPASIRVKGKTYRRIIGMPAYTIIPGTKTPTQQGMERMYRPTSGTYPRRSLAAAVPAKDRKKWEAHCRKHGVNTKYVTDSKGKWAWPEFQTRRQEKAHCKLIGVQNQQDYC